MRPRAAGWQTMCYLWGNNLPNNWNKIWRNAMFKFCMTTVIVLQSENKQTPPLVLVLADFIIRSFPPPPATKKLLFLCFTTQFSGSSYCLNCDNRGVKVAEHSFGSLWVYVICQIMAREKLQLTGWHLASEKYTDKRFWLTGKIWRFRSFHGNMNDLIQP